MPLKIMRPSSPYPRYVYHADHNEPIRVDSKAEETNLLNQGWTTRYLHKEYPKWVNGKVVQSKKEEELARINQGATSVETVEGQDQKAAGRLATAQAGLDDNKADSFNDKKFKPRKRGRPKKKGKVKKPKVEQPVDQPEAVKTTLVDGQEDPPVVGEKPETSGETPEMPEVDEDFSNQNTAGLCGCPPKAE